LPANTVTWQDNGLSAGTSYTYRVHAYNGGGDSAFTQETSGSTTGTATIPPPVVNPPVTPPPSGVATVPNGPWALSATAGTSGVSLKWYDPANNNEAGYVVERRTGASWTTV